MGEHVKDVCAPTYHRSGAHTYAMPHRGGALIVPIIFGNGDAAREREMRAFKLGLMVGVIIGLIVLCLVMCFWAMPAVDGALQAVQAR